MPEPIVRLDDFVEMIAVSPLASWASLDPWSFTSCAADIVNCLLSSLDTGEYRIMNQVATHITAEVEAGAVLKGPLIVGPHCFVASSAYLRGGNWLDEHCTIGPGAELKSSFVFAGTKLAHFNFVGDTILGSGVNLEAGSIICNYRNERQDKEVRVRVCDDLRSTGCQKFGALVGDHCRLGANAVVAPGAILPPRWVVPRAFLHDDEIR